ncbi:hypothetical protein [Paracoccus sp. ME4]|uniref:hypothetical protein n=1 Tax=Paracoccus sp. ME4 TaxID=3138066 RepID=UPI00398AC763
MKALILIAATGATAATAFGVAKGLDGMAGGTASAAIPAPVIRAERVDPFAPHSAGPAPIARPDAAVVPVPVAAASPVAAPDSPRLSLLPAPALPPTATLPAASPIHPPLDAAPVTRRYEATSMPLIGVYR